jgi:tRNA A37 methylthiotransferase MiaB
VSGGEGTESPEAVTERFAALAEAGAQHVIVGIQNIEQPGVDTQAAHLAELVHAIPTT